VPLNETQEALLAGASALRYKAGQFGNDATFTPVANRLTEQADLLDRLSCKDIDYELAIASDYEELISR
jgi:hypothetical protein